MCIRDRFHVPSTWLAQHQKPRRPDDRPCRSRRGGARAGEVKRMDKFCEACGETFQKDPRYSKAQWAAARFCSTACSGASQKGVERPKQELSARFWDQVKKAGQDDCWEWGGARDNHGYGQIAIRQEDGRHRPIKAHRVAWFLTYGRWPTPYALHH